MMRLALLRHGETVWNRERRLTGWADIELSERGVEEAIKAGRLFIEEGFQFDIVYTSLLKRAIHTTWFLLEEMDLLWLPVEKTWRLNERHYGVLQGMSRGEATERYGAERVMRWKRSYDMKPPELDADDKRNPRDDPRYRGIEENMIPVTESLKDTFERILPYWREEIEPKLRSGRRVLIVSHGDTIRALMAHLESKGEEEIVELRNIPTGSSVLYDLDEEMRAEDRHIIGDLNRPRKGWEE